MKILLLLIPISVALLGLAIAAFLWAVRTGQFDDLDTPPLEMLRDQPPDVDRNDDAD
jgi:cbb3-type cytochrome oxidase maturation protein